MAPAEGYEPLPLPRVHRESVIFDDDDTQIAPSFQDCPLVEPARKQDAVQVGLAHEQNRLALGRRLPLPDLLPGRRL